MNTLHHWQTDLANIKDAHGILSHTQRLSHLFESHYPHSQLRVLREAFGPAFVDEINCCPDNSGDYWIREIIIESDNTPLSYGRVVAPQQTFRQHQQALTSLGNRPIGEVYLHHDSQITRSNFEYCALIPQHPIVSMIRSHCQIQHLPKWARRSVFDWHGTPLLITEVMLTEIAMETPL